MSYKIKYRNGTDDTVGIIFIPHQQDNILFILPDSNYVAEGGFGFDFEEDPVIDGLFSTDDNRFWNEISIVWNDTFKHTWYGPPREMPDSIHSFFNYNSWDVIAGPESTTGFVRFTILEADLTAN
ncbi:MAG: hypothetical protein K9J30_09200 [Bacteroidales bacterium]|nr:hypothetical protein [Bacteroidales bacterium]